MQKQRNSDLWLPSCWHHDWHSTGGSTKGDIFQKGLGNQFVLSSCCPCRAAASLACYIYIYMYTYAKKLHTSLMGKTTVFEKIKLGPRRIAQKGLYDNIEFIIGFLLAFADMDFRTTPS